MSQNFMDNLNLQQYFIDHNLKPTPQRLTIAKFLLSTDTHPTAEEIHKAISNELPTPISLATVYNSLEALVKVGIIKEVLTEPNKVRYDKNITNHHHFINTKTGEILDIEPYELISKELIENYLLKNPKQKFKVSNYHITFYGQVEENS